MELLVTLLIDGGAQPLLLPDQVALSEEGGLSAAVEPAGIIIVGKAHIVLFRFQKLRGNAERIHQPDVLCGVFPAHDAGIPKRDKHPQHRKKKLSQFRIGLASVQLTDHIVQDQKNIFPYHSSPPVFFILRIYFLAFSV